MAQRHSMSFGVMPTQAEFKKAFVDDLGAGGVYRIRAGGSDDTLMHEIDGDYTADELFALVRKLKRRWDAGDDVAGSIASDILYTLGIEWV